MKFWKLCVFWKIHQGIRIFNFHVLKIFIESMDERSVRYKLPEKFDLFCLNLQSPSIWGGFRIYPSIEQES